MPEKQRIYLTHLELHARNSRPTTRFSKVAEKGKMYVPFKSSIGSGESESSNARQFEISLPEDLQKDIRNGNVEVMIPQDGLYVFPGKDLLEFMEHREKHAHRDRVWHSNPEEV